MLVFVWVCVFVCAMCFGSIMRCGVAFSAVFHELGTTMVTLAEQQGYEQVLGSDFTVAFCKAQQQAVSSFDQLLTDVSTLITKPLTQLQDSLMRAKVWASLCYF